MTAEQVKKIEDRIINEGMDWLKQKFTPIHLQQFLDCYYIRRRIDERSAIDYTEWRHNLHYGKDADRETELVDQDVINVGKLQYAH
jgi:hypothetical protein